MGVASRAAGFAHRLRSGLKGWGLALRVSSLEFGVPVGFDVRGSGFSSEERVEFLPVACVLFNVLLQASSLPSRHRTLSHSPSRAPPLFRRRASVEVAGRVSARRQGGRHACLCVLGCRGPEGGGRPTPPAYAHAMRCPVLTYE
eukprot:1571057-Rhodomonas_salina.2